MATFGYTSIGLTNFGAAGPTAITEQGFGSLATSVEAGLIASMSMHIVAPGTGAESFDTSYRGFISDSARTQTLADSVTPVAPVSGLSESTAKWLEIPYATKPAVEADTLYYLYGVSSHKPATTAYTAAMISADNVTPNVSVIAAAVAGAGSVSFSDPKPNNFVDTALFGASVVYSIYVTYAEAPSAFSPHIGRRRL